MLVTIANQQSRYVPSPAGAWPGALDEWVELTPSQLTVGSNNTYIGQGFAYAPTAPGRMLMCNGPFISGGGLYLSTNWGDPDSWTLAGACTPLFGGASDHIDNPVRVRINPADHTQVYCVGGVRGNGIGFFISTDGGANFTRPANFEIAATAAGINNALDCYDVAVNPTNWDHVLVSSHSGWGNSYGGNSGVMESTDGGDTWTVHDPPGSVGTGHSVHFLYDVATAQGNSSIWLLGTQSGGLWRTANAGSSWTQESSTNIYHGGAGTWYNSAGTLFIGGDPNGQRSTDNGENWSADYNQVCWTIYGDGVRRFTSHGTTTQPMQVQTNTGGTTYSDMDAQDFTGGPFEMFFDPVSKVLFSATETAGLWGIKTQ